MLEPYDSNSLQYIGISKNSGLSTEANNLKSLFRLKENPVRSKLEKHRRERHTQSDAFVVERVEALTKETDEKAKRETFRLASFRKCKIAVPPYNLAMAGFYYVGPGDRVRCFSCGNCVQSWKPKDDVASERWHASNCRHFFKKGSDNISIGDSSTSGSFVTTTAWSPSSSSEPSLETATTTYPSMKPTFQAHHNSSLRSSSPAAVIPTSLDAKPYQPSLQEPVPGIGIVRSLSHENLLKSLNLCKEKDRRSDEASSNMATDRLLTTYRVARESKSTSSLPSHPHLFAHFQQSFTIHWPVEFRHLVGPLAQTGFFYLGNSDRTQCFSCGAVQKNWLATDDVRKVHAEIFRDCRMVQNMERRNVPIAAEPVVISSSYPKHLRTTSHQDMNYYVSPVFSQANLYGNYYSPASSPQTSVVQNLDFPESHIKAPPALHPSYEIQESSQILRQISNRSTDTNSTTGSLLEGVFSTPNFDTVGGNLTVILPEHSTETLHLISSSTPSTPTTAVPSYSRPEIAATKSYASRASSFSSSTSTLTRSLGNVPTTTFSPLSTFPVSHAQSHPSAFSANSSTNTSISVNETSRVSSQSSTAFSSGTTGPVVTSMATNAPILPVHPPTAVLPAVPAQMVEFESKQPSSSYVPQATGSSQDWIREMDPFAPVVGSFEPELPDLPETELDVDENYISDKHLRFMLREMYPCKKPVKREMVYLSLRLATFRQPWPEHNSLSPIPEVAEAGFYYLGMSDHVCCWYCGIVAKNWAGRSKAWENHALLYPTCEYVLRNRGLGFVEEVTSAVSPEEPFPVVATSSLSSRASSFVISNPPSPYPSSGVIESGPRRLPSPPIVDPREEHARKKEKFESAMQSEMVSLAEGMGFSRSHVRQVIKKQVEEFSCSFQSYEALVEALILTAEDLMEFNSDEEAANDDESTTSNRQVGILEELPDNLDLYQTGDASLSNHPEENHNIGTSQLNVINEHGDVAAGEDDVSRYSDVTTVEAVREVSASQFREEIRASEAASSRDVQLPRNEEDLQAELRRLRDEKRCKICLDRDANMVFTPCGHMCACMQCTQKLKMCPLCRRKINKAYKTY